MPGTSNHSQLKVPMGNRQVTSPTRTVSAALVADVTSDMTQAFGADATAGDAQHRLGEIDGQDRAGRPALLERPAAVAGSGAGIDDMRRRLCRQGGKQQIGYPAL